MWKLHNETTSLTWMTYFRSFCSEAVNDTWYNQIKVALQSYNEFVVIFFYHITLKYLSIETFCKNPRVIIMSQQGVN